MFGRGGEEAEALARGRDRLRGGARGDGRRGRAGLRRHPGDPPRRRVGGGLRDRARGPRQGRSPRSTGTRSPASPARSCFYMGVKNLALIAERLIGGGPAGGRARGRGGARHPARPADRGRQRWPTSPSGWRTRASARRRSRVVGPAAALRETLAWLERRPLHGQVVAVTRARAQASELAARLAALGAEVIEAPAIRIEPRPVELPRIEDFDLICFTSPNGVRLFFERLDGDARALAGVHGGGHRAGHGRASCARTASAPTWCRSVRGGGAGRGAAGVAVEGKRVLVARAAEARDVLPDALRERGAEVDVLRALRHRRRAARRAARGPEPRHARHLHLQSSTVRFFLDGGGQLRRGARGLDRPGDQRHRARARPRGARGGRAPRHRRAGRRAGGGSAR